MRIFHNHTLNTQNIYYLKILKINLLIMIISFIRIFLKDYFIFES